MSDFITFDEFTIISEASKNTKVSNDILYSLVKADLNELSKEVSKEFKAKRFKKIKNVDSSGLVISTPNNNESSIEGEIIFTLDYKEQAIPLVLFVEGTFTIDDNDKVDSVSIIDSTLALNIDGYDDTIPSPNNQETFIKLYV